MDIIRRNVGNSIVLDCAGKLTLGPGTTAARNAVRAALEDGPKRIVMNLAGVDYMDSSGIGELVSSYTHARNKGATLVLLNLNTKVHQLLAVTKLLTIFEIFSDETSAIAGS